MLPEQYPLMSRNVQSFADVTAVVAEGDLRFKADLDPNWSTAGVPSGGYILASLVRAGLIASDKPHVVSMTAHFLNKPQFGHAAIEAVPLRRSRTTDQLRLTMTQQDIPCVETTIGLSTLNPKGSGEGQFWDGGSEVRPNIAYDACDLFVSTPERYPSPMMGQLGLRLDARSMGFMTGSPSERGCLDGWLELAGGENFDPTSLVFALDALPPATFDIQPTAWVPTLTLTAYVRALPAPGPVQIRYRAGLVQGGRVDQYCTIWDSEGAIVAQGTQLASVRMPSGSH